MNFNPNGMNNVFVYGFMNIELYSFENSLSIDVDAKHIPIITAFIQQ